MRRKARQLLLAALAALLCPVGGPGEQAAKDQPAAAEARGNPPPLITVSKETTYITAPLDEDGYPDYLAALNQRYSEGVTPENNAAIPLFKAFGPPEFSGPSQRDQFYTRLGIEPLPEEGTYFVRFDEYVERLRKEDKAVGLMYEEYEKRSAPARKLFVKLMEGPLGEEEIDKLAELELDDPPLEKDFAEARERPWSKKEFPNLAAWLELNRKPLDLVIEACKKERFCSYLLPSGEAPPVLCAETHGVALCRDVAPALAARAMYRVGGGKTAEAWEDLRACHRLARLVVEAPPLGRAIVGFSADATALRCDAAVTHYAHLRRDQIERFRSDLRDLPRLPSLIDKIDVGARFEILDAVTDMARRQGQKLTIPGLDQRVLSLLGGKAGVDWDEVLRVVNHDFDMLVTAARGPGRKQASRDVVDRIESRAKRLSSLGSIASTLILGRRRKHVAQAIGTSVITLLLPSAADCLGVEERNEALRLMTDVAFALAAYRADHEAYPEKLNELVPDYLKEVPVDPCSTGPLQYERDGSGYVLRSVGPDGKDDTRRGKERLDIVMRFD